MSDRAARADEFIQVIKAIWTRDPVEHHGKFFHFRRSHILPKPVQKPHPPIFLAAYTPGSMKRVATLADGWNPTGIPVAGMAQMMEGIRGMAQQAGRNPKELQMIVRGNLYVSPQPMGADRFIFTGSLDQIKADVQACQGIGADEVFFDPFFSPGVASTDQVLRLMEQLRGAAS